MNNTIRNIDLTDEWAQRFLRDVRTAIEAAQRRSCKTTAVEIVEGDPSWLVEEKS